MWWVLFPVRSSMCIVSAAAVTKARQNSSESWGSKGGWPSAPARSGRATVVTEVGAARAVHRHLHERLVERQRDRGEAADARLVAERGRERLPEHDPGVLDRVVGVDLEVAGRLQIEVETTMPAELGEHVVEERQPGRYGDPPAAVEVEGR